MVQDILIASLKKNEFETVRIKKVEYMDEERVDIRIWIKDELGKEFPTKKGISLSLEQFECLRKAINTGNLHLN